MSKNAFVSHLKSADFETVCDWSISPWRNNLDIPWFNNLVITLWCDVITVTPQGHVLFTVFGKLMFEYIFWYEVNQWFLNNIAQKFGKILGFQKMINSYDVQLVHSWLHILHSGVRRNSQRTRALRWGAHPDRRGAINTYIPTRF